MTHHSLTEHTRRDGWRDGSAPANTPGCCPVCDGPLPSSRARYCKDACKQRAFRLRHQALIRVDADELRRNLQRRRMLVAHTLYECSTCGERRLAERRCPECGQFGHALGLAGTCPGCDEPILLTELLELE
jgi:ribosomal protein L32